MIYLIFNCYFHNTYSIVANSQKLKIEPCIINAHTNAYTDGQIKISLYAHSTSSIVGVKLGITNIMIMYMLPGDWGWDELVYTLKKNKHYNNV